MYKLLVNNSSANSQTFFFYQKAPTCGAANSPVVSCSLGTNELGSGAQWIIEIGREIHAAVEAPDPVIHPGPTSLIVASTTIVKQLVQVTDHDTEAMNYTKMSINPLGLSLPINKSDIPLGNFRVWIPSYVPTDLYYFKVGAAETNVLGEDFMSWYIKAPPAVNVDFQPDPIYYVSVGFVSQGKPAPSPGDIPTAACNFNNADVISAVYHENGSWSV